MTSLLGWIAPLVLGMGLAAKPTAPPSPNPFGWQQVYALPDGESWLGTIWADDEAWAAGGRNVLVRAAGGDVQATALAGKTVLGIDRAGHDLFALGADQLVLRFTDKG